MKPILIIQHDEDAGAGYFERYLDDRELPHATVRVFAGDTVPDSAAPYTGICSLGGAMSANDDLPWIESELVLMRDADTRDVPIIGHCLGGQLLAKAFGARVIPNAMKEIGWGTVEADDAELSREWLGEGRTFDLFQWHGDTFAIPRDGRRFLTNDLCRNQAFVIERDGYAHLAMQFHIEMTPQLVQTWVTDADGIREIARAMRQQNGNGVQQPDQMLHDVDRRTRQMHRIADRIYDRWFSSVIDAVRR